MAEDSPVQGLCEETTCSICLEYFNDPVIIDCGHNFCRACLAQCWEKTDRTALCPQCRETVQEKNLRPNRQLASIVEIAKKFRLHTIKGTETVGPVCERHQEPLKLFCQDDQAPICVVCDKAKEHRGHKVIPKEEAFEEYKVKGQACLEFMQKEKKAILSSQQREEAESQTLLKQTEGERQKIMDVFKEMDQFLEAQKNQLLAKLKDLDAQIKQKRNVHIDKLSEEISAIELLIKEMEEKQKQPLNEFLQDLRNISQCYNKYSLPQKYSVNISRNKKTRIKPSLVSTTSIRCNEGAFVTPGVFPLDLKEQIENVSKFHSFLDTTMIEFKDTVLAGPKAKKANFTDSESCTIPTLVLSTDCPRGPVVHYFDPGVSGARRFHSAYNYSHQNPSQFSCWSYVMGVERINSGSCSWVMDINNEKFWAVGVALEDFRRGNISFLAPQQGIWAVGNSNGNLYAFISTGTHQLACPWSSNLIFAHLISPCDAQTIRVSLNHDQGSVTFLNADNDSALYTFHNASFSGQPVSSWFFVGK